MPTITRTTHPLPFEHLDPKRFEDLVRQLSYDFRAWQQLEATGRSGSDDGYDVRGWEIIGDQVTSVEEDESDDRSEEAPIVGEVRRWLIQCKREKEIGPAKMGKYFDGIPAEERHDLYGVIFAAAADFSKKTRDVLRERCRSVGIAECHIWGKAEIEDMLYQPKNDGLLFAYFGISLAIRRRSVRTELRSRLAMKRKLQRAFDGRSYCPILFLDPTDQSYPYRSGRQLSELTWRIFRFDEHHPLGIVVETKRCPAYLHDDRVQFDMANVINEIGEPWENPWASADEHVEHRKLKSEINEILDSAPDRNRGLIIVTELVRFDDILDVDRDGDARFTHPILYVTMKSGEIPSHGKRGVLNANPVFSDGERPQLMTPGDQIALRDGIADRMVFFPDKYRVVRPA